MMKSIFGMQINIEVFCKRFLQIDFHTLGIQVSYKLMLSLTTDMIKHFQSTQRNKFAISLQYLEKEVRNRVHFCMQINIKDSTNWHYCFLWPLLYFVMQSISYFAGFQPCLLLLHISLSGSYNPVFNISNFSILQLNDCSFTLSTYFEFFQHYIQNVYVDYLISFPWMV